MRTHLAFVSRPVARHAADALRVLVMSDAPLFRAGLITILSGFEDLDVVDVDSASTVHSDVILCDESATLTATPAVVLVRDSTAAALALTRGARGVLPRSAAPRRIHAALYAVAESEIVVDETFADALLPHPRGSVAMIEPLTAREREVLQLLAAGLTNKQIAQRLGVTGHTVKFHMNGILGKLGAATRTEAVVEAARRGIIAM